jgi:hypothetical protein
MVVVVLKVFITEAGKRLAILARLVRATMSASAMISIIFRNE